MLGMFVKKTSGPRTVTLADGTILTLADLPTGNERWVARRKAVVVQAIAHGLVSREDALARYGLSDEELDSWAIGVSRHGLSGLKVTAIQKYRL